MDKKRLRRRKRVFEIIEVGNDLDKFSRLYDFINAFAIIVNLIVSVMMTYAEMREKYGSLLLLVEAITVVFFALDYVLRIWTARFLYPDLTEVHAVKKYMCSFTGMVDLLSFLPYYILQLKYKKVN